MKNLTGNQVRQMFLDFFKSKGHMIEPGASLVPVNDPTLLWINAGVAALKKYFDGSEKPYSNRITNAQKSIRTNDIENVGKTSRHHTFFEMLGNFSIGDYFKEDAIQYAWEFLTSSEWIGFDKDKLYISVYTDDEVTYNTWVNICKVDPSHILKTDGNFWEIGSGPSGPDSEIFYDRGPDYDPDSLGEELFFKELENDRYIEVWNIVFSQYDAKEGVDRKDYKELPQKNIDTGMGLERLVSLIQNGETNFDTDLFMPIINECQKLSKFPYDGQYKMAYRVIADHIRTVTFAIADGAAFSNEGRGYVLRRVLRRAVRFGIKLGINEAFMYKLVDVVVKNMDEFYPYLNDKIDFIIKLFKKEEETFHQTLAKGEKLLEDEIATMTSNVLSGEVCFKLYDTYGFPKELTVEICQERDIEVDLNGFEVEMKKQKERAKAARDNDQSMKSQSEDLMNFTENFEFLGYDKLKNDSIVTGIFINGGKQESLSDEGDLCFKESCFYAESGGQVADTGFIRNDNFEAKVIDVQKTVNGQFLHHVKVLKGEIFVADKCHLTIDLEKRELIKANHSALHLLQAALREVLGDHIHQAGSYASSLYGRFDFSHFDKISDNDLEKIENLVNSYIQANLPVTTQVMSIEEAKKTDAIALFDEKYSEMVRVVSMGSKSVEFCGGTHVSRTSELNIFKIEFEESIGSGIRRIQILTKNQALNHYKQHLKTLTNISKAFKLKSVKGVETKVTNLIEENINLSKELAKINEKMLMLEANDVINQKEEINGVNYIFLYKENGGKKLKNFAETIRNKAGNSVVFILNKNEDNLTFVAACSKEAIEKGYKASDMVKLAASIASGKGGGKPDIAQAGGKDITKVNEITNSIRNYLIK